MGVLYDVLFKPIGRGDGSTRAVADGPAVTATTNNEPVPAPEWVLDERGDGTLVWRRYGPTTTSRRKRVEFLDAVQVRVFERDDYGGVEGTRGDADVVDDDKDQMFWADDFATWDDDSKSSSFYCRRTGRSDECTVLVAVSVTVLGLCVGLAYLFAPVKWLFHQLLVD